MCKFYENQSNIVNCFGSFVIVFTGLYFGDKWQNWNGWRNNYDRHGFICTCAALANGHEIAYYAQGFQLAITFSCGHKKMTNEGIL